MKAILSMETFECKGDFGKDIELKEDEYVKMLKELEKDINGIDGLYTNKKNIHYYEDSNEKIIDNFKNANFVSSKVKINNINNENMSVNEFMYNFNNECMFIAIIDLYDIIDDNFESEFKFWSRDSSGITDDNRMSEDDKIKALPMKDLKIKIDENEDEFVLVGCKLYSLYSPTNAAIIVEKIIKL